MTETLLGYQTAYRDRRNRGKRLCSMLILIFRKLLSVLMFVASVHRIFGDDTDNLRTLQDKYWDWQMKTNPETSTYYGVHKYNDQVNSFNVSNFETHRTEVSHFLDELGTINRASLSKENQVNYDILNDSLSTFLEGSKWAEYGALSSISFLGGVHLSWCPPFGDSTTRGDFENYIIRLRLTQRKVDEIKEAGQLAILLNRTLHNVSMARVPGQIDENIFDTPEESPCYSYIEGKLNQSAIQNEADRNDIMQRSKDAIIIYMDAFKDLKDFMVNEYMQNSRTEWGVSAWDPSHEYYSACIKWHLSFAMTPEEVFDTGVREVERITAEMKKILRNLRFDGSVADFFKSLENNTNFYSDNSTIILDEYKHVVFERINPKLDTVFKYIPDVPLLIEASSSDGIGVGYSKASETRPGRFIINLFRPLEVPFFEMMALSLHEANPGHHMQHSYSMFANLADFRKDPILSFYNIPNWIPYYSAYSEGWALYSEYLGEEMGLYKDQYEMMGRYSYEILRACRLVVDTGLHRFGWSREEAIEYLTNYTALGRGSAENEIDRYITWPGQAVAYKLGELKIKDLRKMAEQELGSRFDLKDFHLLLLENGAMPINILESMVTDWIAAVKSSNNTSEAALHTQTLVFILCMAFISVIVRLGN